MTGFVSHLFVFFLGVAVTVLLLWRDLIDIEDIRIDDPTKPHAIFDSIRREQDQNERERYRLYWFRKAIDPGLNNLGGSDRFENF